MPQRLSTSICTAGLGSISSAKAESVNMVFTWGRGIPELGLTGRRSAVQGDGTDSSPSDNRSHGLRGRAVVTLLFLDGGLAPLLRCADCTPGTAEWDRALRGVLRLSASAEALPPEE